MERRVGGQDAPALVAGSLPKLHRIYKGAVKSIQDYGAFIELEGFSQNALLHVSQMSSMKIGHPEEILSMGDQVWVKVISVEENGKLAVSMKTINQRDGSDSDPTHIVVEQDKMRKRKVGEKEVSRLELGAVLNTVCTKCGVQGHFASNCFAGAAGGKTYAIIDDDGNDVIADETQDKHKRKHKKEKKKKNKKNKKHSKKDRKHAHEEVERSPPHVPKKGDGAAKGHKSRRNSGSSSSDDDEAAHNRSRSVERRDSRHGHSRSHNRGNVSGSHADARGDEPHDRRGERGHRYRGYHGIDERRRDPSRERRRSRDRDHRGRHSRRSEGEHSSGRGDYKRPKHRD